MTLYLQPKSRGKKLTDLADPRDLAYNWLMARRNNKKGNNNKKDIKHEKGN